MSGEHLQASIICACIWQIQFSPPSLRLSFSVQMVFWEHIYLKVQIMNIALQVSAHRTCSAGARKWSGMLAVLSLSRHLTTAASLLPHCGHSASTSLLPLNLSLTTATNL